MHCGYKEGWSEGPKVSHLEDMKKQQPAHSKCRQIQECYMHCGYLEGWSEGPNEKKVDSRKIDMLLAEQRSQKPAVRGAKQTATHYKCFVHKLRALERHVRAAKSDIKSIPNKFNKDEYMRKLASCLRCQVRIELERLRKQSCSDEVNSEGRSNLATLLPVVDEFLSTSPVHVGQMLFLRGVLDTSKQNKAGSSKMPPVVSNTGTSCDQLQDRCLSVDKGPTLSYRWIAN
ncbi:hypothetical protein DPMN_181081 [Dreissena polymorpha]|uniref:Uncharacterized protein n=1 Tax=Dreissena polymorpha TaxID=45954 RepID=A0A9D4DD02_DREPO|nr:hypothetical protein DPMN_181081 [Dreissena polymorpha]